MGIEQLSKQEKKDLKEMVKLYQEQWGELTNEKVEPDVVTKDNVEEYLTKYNELEYCLDRSLTEDQRLLAKDKLCDVLKPFMIEIGLEQEYIENMQQFDISHVISERLKVYNAINEAEQNAIPVLDSINNPPNMTELKNKVQEYISTSGFDGTIDNPQNVDTGDGDFNEVVKQKTNVCWGLAGINTLAQSEVGRSILEGNRYRDEETGIYAIHLKEAENSGLQSGGIYIITPQEIADVSQTVAEGEGDSIAYMLAVDKYFDELRTHKPELADEMKDSGKYTNDISEGNLSSRFFEIITGGSAFRIGQTSTINDEIPNGISFGNGISFEQISEIIESKKGAVVLSVMNNYSSENMGHAISVVGVRDGKLLIQESTNDKEQFLDAYKNFDNENIFTETEPVNGAPTYLLNIDDFNNFTMSRAVLRWE
jgi:hypothetical protein